MMKKISRVKRHIALVKFSLPDAIFLTKDHVRKVTLNLFYLYNDNLNNVQNILADVGYSSYKFTNTVYKILHCPVEIACENTLYKFSVILKTMASSFEWLEKM